MAMNDAELAGYLHITLEQAATYIPKLTPEKRALFDRMKNLENEIELWQAGLGPKPTGVLMDFERDKKRNKFWR